MWGVHPEINRSKSAISVFQAIVGTTDQAPKDFYYTKRLQQHVFFFGDIRGESLIKPWCMCSDNRNVQTTGNSWTDSK